VKSCGPTVGCTITAHHLTLTVDDWAGNGLNFCKPVAKFPDDREALREVIREGSREHIISVSLLLFLLNKSSILSELGHPRFFLGSDSAPHPITSKLPNHPTSCCAAGIYTSPHLLPNLASIFESAIPPPASSSETRQILSPIPLDRLNGFVSTFGRAFYGIEKKEKGHTLTRDDETIVQLKITGDRDHEVVVPFWAGRKLGWKLNT
jgi:dihydroorotase